MEALARSAHLESRRPWRGPVLGLLAGALGFCLLWSGWHLWIDHRNMHAVLDWAIAIQQQNTQQATRQQPPPPATAPPHSETK